VVLSGDRCIDGPGISQRHRHRRRPGQKASSLNDVFIVQIVMSDSKKGGIDMLRSSIAAQPIKNAPTPEEIRQRAYEIHIERGGLYGCDMDDLLQAERELQKKYKNSEK
jgi:Protein of unknown function (DUF2934)